MFISFFLSGNACKCNRLAIMWCLTLCTQKCTTQQLFSCRDCSIMCLVANSKLLLGIVGSFESDQREHYEEIFLLIWFLPFSVSFWCLLCFFTLRHTCHSLAGRLKRSNPSVANKGKGKSLSPWILIQIDHRLKTHTLECTHTLSLHTHAPPGKRGQFISLSRVSWPTLVIKSGSRKTPGRDKWKIDNKLLGYTKCNVKKRLINECILLQNDLQIAAGCSVSGTASIQDCSNFSFWEKVEIGVPEFRSWLFGGFSVTKHFLKHLGKGCFYVFQAWFQFPIANRQDQTSMTFKWINSSTSFQHRPHSWP